MRYQQEDLPILSAETYNPGGESLPTAQFNGKRTQQRDNSKKRKSQSSDAAESDHHEEEEKKRTRGRPRLDTKDETAAERRRTQIRLAQRAYRNRKENAIQTLEKRVSDLKKTNEEMSDAFMRLHDFAVGNGLLDQAPEFARQLRVTTQMFLALARQSTEDSGKEEGQVGSPEQIEGDMPGTSQAESHIANQETAAVTPEAHDKPEQRQLLYGLSVTHEPIAKALLASAEVPISFDTSDSDPNLDYEVVTYPTLDNASFPFSTDLDLSAVNPTPSPFFQTLPAPGSYAAQETTFGRRLQRTTVERALNLINMADPPRNRFARIFGFCMLFESVDDIRKRLQAVVDRNRQESLYNWEYPFLHLGGAGTHFNMTEFNGQPIGNQGTAAIRKPKVDSGFGTGPYNEKIVEAGNLVNKNHRLELPGYRSDFYDCDEVEMYLRQRGVTIPGSADYITAEINASDFENSDDRVSVHSSVETSNEHLSSRQGDPDMAGFNGIDAIRDLAMAINVDPINSRSPSASTGDASTTITVPSPGPDASKPWNMVSTPTDPMLEATFPAPSSNPFMDAITTAGTLGNSGLLSFDGTGIHHPDSRARRKIVTVDVNLFIWELTERATCLGRTPGLRKTDINAAFAIATRAF